MYERKNAGGDDTATGILEVKKIVEAIGRGFEEYKATNDAMLKAKAEGKAIGDLEAKLAQAREGR
jgi:hypothetical protein